VTPYFLVDIYKVSEESTDPTFQVEHEGNIPVECIHRGIRENMNPSKWGMSGTSVYILFVLTSVTISPNYKQIKVSTNTPNTFFSRNLQVLKSTIFVVAFLESENFEYDVTSARFK
jgi:hypothetical protein